MDKDTETALRASIKHWQENVGAEEFSHTSIGPYHCALCDKFNFEGAKGCFGCPVQDATGQSHCEGSPYAAAAGAYVAWRSNHNSAGRKVAFKEAAQAELDFLKSLLPTPPEET